MRVAGARLALWLPSVSIALVLAACGGSSGTRNSDAPDEIAITCTGPLATPGATPSAVATAGSCAQSLGAQVAHADCATAIDMGSMDGFQHSELNTHNGSATDQKVTASSQSGRCVFTVPGGYVAYLQAKEPIQDGLTIVDFIPRSGENSVGLLLRCPKVGYNPCLAVFMYSNQTYDCVEGIGKKTRTTLAHGTFAGQQFPAPQLEVNQPNRLVFSIKGDAVSGYINGRQICGGKTEGPVTSSGAAVQIAQAGGSAPAGVDIIDFYVFAAP
jgi:hypothetical protein